MNHVLKEFLRKTAVARLCQTEGAVGKGAIITCLGGWQVVVPEGS